MAYIIESYNISHRYGKVTALDDVTFTVGDNELFGFIGPDGAGKTTLFRLAATLMVPSEGHLSMLGQDTVKDFRQLRNRIGYMPGRFSLYQDLTVEENLNFYAAIFGSSIHENYHLVEPIYRQIEPFRKRLAGRLSGGMKQKLALSCALIHKPDILILDEPTTGVDVVSRVEFWEMLAGLKKEGITIIVSTPYMDEALRCDRIALIQSGRILGIDTPENIRNSYSRTLYAVRHTDKYGLLMALRALSDTGTAANGTPGTGSMTGTPEPFGEAIHITLGDTVTPSMLEHALSERGLTGATVEEITPGIEDVFLELMKRDRND